MAIWTKPVLAHNVSISLDVMSELASRPTMISVSCCDWSSIERSISTKNAFLGLVANWWSSSCSAVISCDAMVLSPVGLFVHTRYAQYNIVLFPPHSSAIWDHRPYLSAPVHTTLPAYPPWTPIILDPMRCLTFLSTWMCGCANWIFMCLSYLLNASRRFFLIRPCVRLRFISVSMMMSI